ncbi:3-oxoacyl-[acyl-carrier-protein] synthase III C-terminal domain-containing protein [Rhodococcus sp. H29-C3]|uniref:3-oxoacyl-[acyl-carrier-protein] synthase III C-terminal domain-containing protein n=1 Tax=Rhodococcus sp. H29-C3 TaxID=3046307 RepID=UPI0024B91262|nr:3-oxoacyl-[acyl-carrier-protein] synthase III C-terminal domain-containing protein [Rhodococcus sp. H29-C3]MDJ0363193.1 3-oxoacyl-[acyl-carrier-protein] synthase III C-terminal domain-containing protein [Rhodococcus sp. H29-C3]
MAYRSLGKLVSHRYTGAADPLLGLDIVRRTEILAPGDRIMLTGIGVGFTWRCAVVEYTGYQTSTKG